MMAESRPPEPPPLPAAKRATLHRLLGAAVLLDLAILVAGMIFDSHGWLTRHDVIGGLGHAPKLLPMRLHAQLWYVVYALLALAYFGLLVRWPWARAVYVVVWACSFFLAASGPEQALNSLGGDLMLLSGFVGGFLICLIYFTPLADEFRPRH
jgi:hypothetical protein